MHLKFKNKKITGILSVLPSNEINYLDEIGNYNFSEKQSIKLGKIMGYGSRRIVNSNTSVSDLCTHGLNYLFDNKNFNSYLLLLILIFISGLFAENSFIALWGT